MQVPPPQAVLIQGALGSPSPPPSMEGGLQGFILSPPPRAAHPTLLGVHLPLLCGGSGGNGGR